MLSVCGEIILCDMSSCSKASVFLILYDVSSFFKKKNYGSYLFIFIRAIGEGSLSFLFLVRNVG